MSDFGTMTTGNDANGLVFNLNNVEDKSGGFEVLPKGDYEAIVDEMVFKESAAGNPMIAVTYEIVQPEYEGRKIFDFWVLSGNGAEFGLLKLKKFLSRICPEVNMGAFNPETFCDEGTAIGRDVILKLKVQTQKKGDYAGEKRNSVQDVQAKVASFM